MIPLLSALIGLLAGVHSATWGMYKDAPHEGFSWRKYARSPILGAALGAVIEVATGLDPRHAGSAVVLFGVIYAVERALAEIYKTFLREEDQSKYFIPIQFHVLGRVIRSRPARLIAGALYTTLLLGLIGFVAHLDRIAAGTFFFPSKPRGKFAGKPVRYPEMLLRRQRFVLPYAAIWAGLLLAAMEAARG
jgi:hypothetical protein